MPWFTTNFAVTTSDGRHFTLSLPVVYWTNIHKDHLDQLTIPAGTESDGASIPELCWIIPGFAPFGLHWRAAVLHDALYRGKLGLQWTRQECDDIFYEAMISSGVDDVHARTIYNAVREFGQASFDKDRNES